MFSSLRVLLTFLPNPEDPRVSGDFWWEKLTTPETLAFGDWVLYRSRPSSVVFHGGVHCFMGDAFLGVLLGCKPSKKTSVSPSEQDLQGRPNGFGEWQDNSYHGEVCHENHWNSNGRVIARPLKWAENPQLSILGQFFLCGHAFVQGHLEIKNHHISKHKSGPDGKG